MRPKLYPVDRNPSNGFNPLFIGSKDATFALSCCTKCHKIVSIPFSSGQRMRLNQRPSVNLTALPVSIPFSSGQRMRRIWNPAGIGWREPTFQSPFHRVKGCDHGIAAIFHFFDVVSIPFSSGQRMRPASKFSFRLTDRPFQSPFHRVKGCDSGPESQRLRNRFVSIPFSSGQRMRPRWGVKLQDLLRGFNPLFIGSKDATIVTPEPFLAVRRKFQSPFHRVKGCDRPLPS